MAETASTIPIVLIGCGFVADLYMRSFRLHREARILGAWDRDPARLRAFTDHWSLDAFPGAEAAFAAARGGIVLNLTNPSEHAGVTRAALAAGAHVFSEKPLTSDMGEARALAEAAGRAGLHLASAPSSVLSRAAQTLLHALRAGRIGAPRLVYAELDDGFIPQAPVRDWQSASGAPWPWADEFRTGCTLEHAGYWLSWLIAAFGPVSRVVTAAEEVLPDKPAGGAPDASVATLTFRGGGPMARLTCSIVAPHDHRLRIIGERGALEVDAAWDNAAPVHVRPRFRLRRRLVDSPLRRRHRLPGRQSHPFVTREGAASMNFALGPLEMAGAIAAGRAPRLAGDYALHLTEVTLACQRTGVHEMTTACPPMEPMPWAR
ncbi:Gfo/Idh/MocA family protein [Wenxinia saemankumensis]|uniref:Predicted dehydrogenase n=1 Tax=Wenxinia saemankumensis TaxID=1447782 RepID=A0A1M6FYV6_9RHOB|nr:Gfo/Idh/MocA family oxidoreductase [Wenxinia saemankumensis]SHJ02938.1 Predicted dehydrogenase [Wenxinia saemankumensis]